MAVGFTSSDGHFETIQTTIDNGIDFSRSQLPQGESEIYCLDCGNEITEARRLALKGVKYCIKCQTIHESTFKESYNRRGSKDSQLR